MDSVSQLVLGAAIGELTLGRKLGRSALILGGALGTLPDLDVLVTYGDAVASFTYHRSWSHSVFTLSLLSLFLAWLLQRFYPKKWINNDVSTGSPHNSPSYANWLLCTWLALVTHPLLDGLTVYGTQLFWPVTTLPVAWGSMFIIDPLYTVPLIVAVWISWRHRNKAKKAAIYGLTLSSVYIAITLTAQQHAKNIAIASLAEQSLNTSNVLIAPSPLSLLWRIVSMDDTQYYEGFYSIFDSDAAIHFDSYQSNRSLINNNIDHWPVARLNWFTRGMLSAANHNERLIINDLRMGVESSYVFRFDIGPLADSKITGTEISTLVPMEFNNARMKAILKRVWDESIHIPD